MNKLALVLACLACTCQGRRVHTSSETLQSRRAAVHVQKSDKLVSAEHVVDLFEELAKLLSEVHPAALFNPSGLGSRLPDDKATPRTSRPVIESIRRSNSAGSAAWPPSAQQQLHAVCDRRSRSCRIVTAEEARASTPVMQGSSACATPPASVFEEMPKQYSPADVEERLYKWWESSGYFKPSEDSDQQCFVISMPPPNVTGKLHMGHAMFVALEDIMTRFHRMRGSPTLWLPGTDHAGIATQMLVERALRADGVERKEIGREAFLEKVWDWKEEYGSAITEQIRRLGASCDWSREKFTLQPELCDAVAEAFVSLHERGLVYRGDYMVNWSPELGTAVSDLEVDYVDEDGSLYYFKYRLADSDEFIPVATTRPETILGDEAVCVHPEDERYKHLIGKEVLVPIQDRRIPVIADEYVEMEFGTGALKITPAHDINDYAIGKRFKLPMTNILNKDATLNEVGGKYEGLDRYDCRKKLWADMEESGLVIKVDKHSQRVPRSQRSGEVIEPMISSQWFVKMDGMAKKALDAVRNGDIKIIPDRFEKVYFNWLEDIRDWCVSRQLWWGHRIPVWYADGHPGKYYVARNAEEAQKKAEAELGSGVTLTQDEDVLDTWFSSGLWPFATVGWPAKEGPMLEEYNRFYPSSVMETGYDILFFWVARMVMLGLEFTGKPPFHTIYMHGLVRDGQGQKMSKTKGNVVDPIETIADYGTDALRLSLVTGVTPGLDVPLSMEKVTANRNFANKLWNTGRFLVMGLEELSPEERSNLAVREPPSAEWLATLPLPERWVISRCNQLIASVTAQLSNYEFGPAGQSIQQFLWDEYADWYIEISKRRIQGAETEAELAAALNARKTLVYALDSCLRLLHPFMPFITEEIWQRLPHEGPSLMVAPWPQRDNADLPVDEAALKQFASFQNVIRSIRNAKNEYQATKKIPATILASHELLGALKEEADPLAFLARLDFDKLEFAELKEATEPAPVDAAPTESAPAISPVAGNWAKERAKALAEAKKAKAEETAPDDSKTAEPKAAEAEDDVVRLLVEEGLEARLPLAGLIDPVKERKRLEKQKKELTKVIDGLTNRLAAPGFADKAPANVVDKAKADLAEKSETLKTVNAALEKLPA